MVGCCLSLRFNVGDRTLTTESQPYRSNCEMSFLMWLIGCQGSESVQLRSNVSALAPD